MNFKDGDILISEHGSLGMFDSSIRSSCMLNVRLKHAIDRCHPYPRMPYRAKFGVMNPRKANSEEIALYKSLLNKYGYIYHDGNVSKINDEF